LIGYGPEFANEIEQGASEEISEVGQNGKTEETV